MATLGHQALPSLASMDKLLAVDIDSISMRCRFGHYDYIIVGSGIGGGILAEQLVEQKKKVLLIEKGGPLFSTHILNTPRPDYTRGRDDSAEGNEIIYAATKQTIQTAENSEPYVGGPLYCLGGRSNVWGLWTPRAHTETLTKYFPPEIETYLTANDGYTRAFNLMTNNSQINKIYPDGNIDPDVLSFSTNALKSALQESYLLTPVGIGPIATELNSPAAYRFPQGAYSTTVPLLNRIYARDEYLTILMNHECLRFEYDPSIPEKQVKSLTVRSMADHKLYSLEVSGTTKTILSAGTLCTAKIALNSGLQLDNPLVGKGMIDHEVYALRFAKEQIGAAAPPLYLQCMIKICGTTALLTLTINANYLLSSGGRGAPLPTKQYISKDGVPYSERERPSKLKEAETKWDTMQILLEYHAELNEGNEVLDVPTPEPVIRVRRPNTHTDEVSQIEMQRLATIIRDSFPNGKNNDGAPIRPPPPSTPGFDNDLAPRMELLGFGVFAHEVGTMRMPSPSRPSGTSVVDSDLKVLGFNNLFVCDLSVFPCSTEANPTLTLAALSMRLSKYLVDGNYNVSCTPQAQSTVVV